MTFPRSVPTLLYRRLDIDGDPDCSVVCRRFIVLSREHSDLRLLEPT